jgi:dTDP-4-amino-4,6-dideoxygalactose transaminase
MKDRNLKRQFVPFALPEIGEEEIAEVVDSLRSGWITTGPKTRRFEEDFAAYLGGDLHAIAVNSATAGLHLALEAIGIGADDQVIVPTHTFTATAEVVRYLGADPVFVDIDLASYCIDPSAVAAAIGPRTKAILPVHYGGLSCDMAPLLQLAERHRLHIIEDAAHAFPSTYGGKLIGTLPTDAAIFSFYATKTIATGEGGMLVTRNGDLARRARIMRLHGIDRDAFDRYTAKQASWYYEVVAPGFKYNMTDLAASLGIHQLRKARRMQERRTELARRYREAFRNLPLVLPPAGSEENEHSWHLFVIRLGEGARLSRDALINGLYERGVGASVHYIPLHLQPYWRDRYKLSPRDFPRSQQMFETAVSLPIYSKMSDAEQDTVITAVKELVS